MKKLCWAISFLLSSMLFLTPILQAYNTDNGDGIIEPGENTEEELTKATQNPVADLINLPFQNDTNFSYGPDDDIQNLLYIQPVVPFHLNENWNLINRAIAPLICQPEVVEGTGDEFGFGDINFTAFFSPKRPTNSIIWGDGPIFVIPTATYNKLGSEKWSAGPLAVVLTIQGQGLYGALINDVKFQPDSNSL